jgi:hypothetical protein
MIPGPSIAHDLRQLSSVRSDSPSEDFARLIAGSALLPLAEDPHILRMLNSEPECRLVISGAALQCLAQQQAPFPDEPWSLPMRTRTLTHGSVLFVDSPLASPAPLQPRQAYEQSLTWWLRHRSLSDRHVDTIGVVPSRLDPALHSSMVPREQSNLAAESRALKLGLDRRHANVTYAIWSIGDIRMVSPFFLLPPPGERESETERQRDAPTGSKTKRD